MSFIVLGDVAHSPRTTAHAACLLAAGVRVHLVATGGPPPPPLAGHPRLVYTGLPDPPAITRGRGAVAFLVTAAWSVVVRSVALAVATIVKAPATWDVVLLQVPPAIPAAAVVAAAVAVRHRGAGLVVDWHNFGFTLLGGSAPGVAVAGGGGGRGGSPPPTAPPRAAVRLAEWVERGVARWGWATAGATAPSAAVGRPGGGGGSAGAGGSSSSGLAATARRAVTGGGRVAHFVVSTAMRDWLAASWGVPAAVRLPDLPRSGFAPPPPPLLPPATTSVHRGGSTAAAAVPSSATRPLTATDAVTGRAVTFAMVAVSLIADTTTPGGVRKVHRVVPRRGDNGGGSGGGGGGDGGGGVPPLVVTATSWTADEDFSALVTGLRCLDDRLAGRSSTATSSPALVVLATGRGPLRSAILSALTTPPLVHIQVLYGWLPADDYPLALCAADAGLCLHASSSGVDLPMKAVDMLAVGLPVLARAYPALGELLVDGETAVLFDDGSGLADALDRLVGWEAEWARVAAPVLWSVSRQQV
ncbi:hypothetical protein MMPV_003522 [Pyropia vietnamensis]